jgi:hypothetical protein
MHQISVVLSFARGKEKTPSHKETVHVEVLIFSEHMAIKFLEV